MAIGEAIEAQERPEAKKRKKAGIAAPRAEPWGNLPQGRKRAPRVADKAAAVAGVPVT